MQIRVSLFMKWTPVLGPSKWTPVLGPSKNELLYWAPLNEPLYWAPLNEPLYWAPLLKSCVDSVIVKLTRDCKMYSGNKLTSLQQREVSFLWEWSWFCQPSWDMSNQTETVSECPYGLRSDCRPLVLHQQDLWIQTSYEYGSLIYMGTFYSLIPNSRDRLEVRTLRCGRNNPGSNPGHGTLFTLFFPINFLYLGFYIKF